MFTEPAKTNSQRDFLPTISAGKATLIGLILGSSPAGRGCRPRVVQNCPGAESSSVPASRLRLAPVFRAGARAAVSLRPQLHQARARAPARPPDHLQGGGEERLGQDYLATRQPPNKNSELAPWSPPSKSRRPPILAALTVFASSAQNLGAGTLGIQLKNRVLEGWEGGKVRRGLRRRNARSSARPGSPGTVAPGPGSRRRPRRDPW